MTIKDVEQNVNKFIEEILQNPTAFCQGDGCSVNSSFYLWIDYPRFTAECRGIMSDIEIECQLVRQRRPSNLMNEIPSLINMGCKLNKIFSTNNSVKEFESQFRKEYKDGNAWFFHYNFNLLLRKSY